MRKDLLDFDEHRPLGELVFDYLREQILTGGISPGERLMEVALSQKLGVSRTPIREAIRRLEKENFIIIYPRRGAFVADLTESEMLEMLEIRKELEGFAAKLAAERMNEIDLQELKKFMNDFENATKSGNKKLLMISDNNFHSAILSGTKNQKLIDIISELQDQFQRFRLHYFKEIENYDEIRKSHERIYEAISRGDGDGARVESEAHVIEIKAIVDKWTRK